MMVGVLLAAGAGTRMGGNKAMTKHKGLSFLAHGVRHLWATCDVVVVVLGHDAKRVQKEAEDEFVELVDSGALTKDLHEAQSHGAKDLELRFVVNAGWKAGMLSSARVGIAEGLRSRPDALLVLPVDHPKIKGETVGAIGGMMREALGASGKKGSKSREGFAYALVPRFKGHRGHPLALSPLLARAIVKDRDARDLGDAVRRQTRLLGFYDVKDAGIIANINTPAKK